MYNKPRTPRAFLNTRRTKRSTGLVRSSQSLPNPSSQKCILKHTKQVCTTRKSSSQTNYTMSQYLPAPVPHTVKNHAQSEALRQSNTEKLTYSIEKIARTKTAAAAACRWSEGFCPRDALACRIYMFPRAEGAGTRRKKPPGVGRFFVECVLIYLRRENKNRE